MKDGCRSNRRWAITATLVIGTLVVAACSSDDKGTAPTATTSAASSAASTAAAPSSAPGTSGTVGSTPSTASVAPGSLVVNGEVIADAQLFEAAKTEGKLTLYTTQTQAQQEAINKAFTEDTGIEVEFFRDAGASMTQRILTEADGGVHNADVIELTSPFDMQSLDGESLLVGYEPTTIGNHLVPTDEIGPDGKWYPVGTALYVIGVNRGVVGDTPVATWDDILKPEFKGHLGITPAGVGGTGIAQAAFQKEVLGEDYWTRLGAADPVIFNSTATVAQSLATGDISVAIAAESVLRPLVDAGGPIELVYPDKGVIGLVGYQAVAAQAPHPSVARLYQDWALSKRGQEVQATDAGGRSIRDDVDDPGIEPPRSDLNVWFANLSQRGDTKDQLVADWNAAVGYSG